MDDFSNLSQAVATFEQKQTQYAQKNAPELVQGNEDELVVHYAKAFCYADRDVSAGKTVQELRWYIMNVYKWANNYNKNSALLGDDEYRLKQIYNQVASQTNYSLAVQLVTNEILPDSRKSVRVRNFVSQSFNVDKFDQLINSQEAISYVRMLDIATNYIGFIMLYVASPIPTLFWWLDWLVAVVMLLIVLPAVSYYISFAERAFLDACDQIAEAKHDDNYVYKNKSARRKAHLWINYAAVVIFGLVFLIDMVMSAVPLIVSFGAPWGWASGVFVTFFIEWAEFREFKAADIRRVRQND